MSKINGNRYSELKFLNEDDPVKLLSSNNYLDQLVPVIKTSLRNNTIEDLIEKLRAEDTKKNDEIAVLLGENEGNIAFSANNIAKVSRDASNISEQLLDINDHLSRTSNQTIEKKFRLLELKKNISKINESEILIHKVLQVLELTDKTQDLINNNKFFNGLKNLNDLTALNKDFDKDLNFLNTINDSVPHLRNSIRDESISLMKRNLGALDSKIEQFTTSLYERYSNLLEEWDSFKSKNKDFSQYKVNSSVERSLRCSYSLDELPELEETINIEFIYDTFLVFKTLEQVEFFKDEFSKELLIKRDKLLYPFQINDPKNTNFQQFIKTEDNLKQFLSRVIGFLILHNLISSKFPSLVTQHTNDLWENLSTKLYPYLKNLILNEILDINRIINIKKILGNFYLILEHFNLNYDHFYNVLILSFKKYSQMAQHKFNSEFLKLTQEDDSMPMVVYDLKLYKKITSVGWYKDGRTEQELKFPEVLPFSSIYPMACAQSRTFISQQQLFLKDYFKFELNSLYKIIIENVDTVLNYISKFYNDKLNLITREELSQNLINLEYFLIMAKEISDLLSSTFEKLVILKSVNAIADARKLTEGKLFELVDGKVDDLIDFLDWDWQATVTNQEPNYFIKDIGDFLKNMFNSTFSNLPASVKSLLLYRVFDLLAKRFLDDLNSQSYLSEAAISNFDLDIAYIEGITQELSPSKDEKTSKRDSHRTSLQSMFLQLRQTINLLKTGHLDDYRDQAIRNRVYDQIKPESAVSLISKLSKRTPVPEPVSSPNTSAASKYFMKFRNNNANNDKK